MRIREAQRILRIPNTDYRCFKSNRIAVLPDHLVRIVQPDAVGAAGHAAVGGRL
jgi:hypothetical protein